MSMELEGIEEESTLTTLLESIEHQIQSKKSEGKLSLGHNKKPDLSIEQVANGEELVTFFRDRPGHINMSAAVAATAMVTAAAAAITAAAALNAKGNKPKPKEQVNLMDANTKGLNVNDLLSLRNSCL